VHDVRVSAERKEALRTPPEPMAGRNEFEDAEAAEKQRQGHCKKEQPGVDVGLSMGKVTHAKTKVKYFLKKYLQ
jgi:hypothetical protein